jgi:D-amino-acid dehydrogenase
VALAGARCWPTATTKSYEINKGRMVRLAEYSRDCLVRCAPTPASPTTSAAGHAAAVPHQKQYDGAAADIAVLERYKVPYELLDRAGCEGRTGAGPRARQIRRRLRLPGDETGDCFKFTQALAAMAEQLGVKFAVRRRHRAPDREGDQITGVVTSKGELKADRLRAGAGQLFAAAAQAGRPAHSRCIR